MSEVKKDKACPFCGNPVVQTTVDDGCHWISCPKCSATGPTEFLRSDEDSPGWNTRPDFDAQRLRADTAEALSVTSIMLDVVPGEDGMGKEVYAKSVAEVQLLISNLYLDAETAGEKLAAAEQRIVRHENMLRHFASCADVRQVGTSAMDYVAALNPNPEAESHE